MYILASYPRFLMGWEEKNLVSSIFACTQISTSEHVFKKEWEGIMYTVFV